MKILVISDQVDPYLYDYYTPNKLKDIDLIISCGDLPARYLEFLVTVANKPLFYVHGNHDTAYLRHAPEGCVDIDGRVYEYKGLRIAGLGGCMKYNDSPFMYTESEMQKRINKLKPSLWISKGVDILVTHAPAEGYGDLDDLPHTGYACFNELLEKYKPAYMVHGHVHQEYGQFQRELTHESGTKIVNGYQKTIIEVEPPEQTEKSFLYPYFVTKF